jgi:hypothetical protein
VDEEAEDRLTELARSRLADTLSEAARLLSGPSDPAPARRTERLGIDEVLLGLSRHPSLSQDPDPESASSPSGEPPADAPEPAPAAGTPGPGAGGTPRWPSGPSRLRTEVDQLREAVETARQRVEAAEARAEEHETALDDLRTALDRLRRAGAAAPPYERPSFASVVIGEPASIPPAPLPVVAFSLGTVPGPPAVLHAARLGPAPRPAVAPVRAQLVEADRRHTGPPAPGSTAPDPTGERGPSDSRPPAAAGDVESRTGEDTPVSATVASASDGAADLADAGSGTAQSAEPSGAAPGPDPAGARGAEDGNDAYSWPFVPPGGQQGPRAGGGRRRFWHRW